MKLVYISSRYARTIMIVGNDELVQMELDQEGIIYRNTDLLRYEEYFDFEHDVHEFEISSNIVKVIIR